MKNDSAKTLGKDDEQDSKFSMFVNNNCDAIGISCRGIFHFCNQSFLDTFRYASVDELVGRSVLDVIAPECHEKVKEYIFKRSHHETIPNYFEFIGIRKDGSFFDFEITSTNYTDKGEIYSIVIGRDITEKKKAQQTLKESEENFRIAFHSNPSVVGISSLEKGIYLEVNEQFSKVFGWKKEEILGRTSQELHIFKDYIQRAALVKELVEKGNIRNFECELQTKNGNILSTEVNVDLIDFQQQKCLLVQINDVTDRKKAETALKALNADLEDRVKKRTQELEDSIHELEAFTHSISHDFKAPLRAINAYCQLCLEETKNSLTEDSKIRLNKMKASSLYMSQLIDDLLNFYQIKNLVMGDERFNASLMVHEILESFKSRDPDRDVKIIIQDNLWIEGDKRLIKNVFSNLLDNAWKFTAPHQNSKIEFGCLNESGEVVYFIRDNGIGFNMNYVGKLFGTFQKLHGSFDYPGTGIGLAIVQKIIHLHQGKVWVESEVEKGSTFFFTLPRVP